MKPIEIRDTDFKRADGCGREHAVTLKRALIAPDALAAFEETARACGFPDGTAAVYDENTWEALRGVRPKAKREIVLPAAGLHADERGVALAEEKLGGEEALIAAGSGTMHDIVRYVCTKRGLPFAGVPTAASVDGYASSVAAMTLGGYKVTVNAAAPVFLIADLNVIAKAPLHLAASGLGDVLGKFVSLTEWEIAREVTGEYWCAGTAALMGRAADGAYRSAEGAAAGDCEAFGDLMRALVLSGVAMQLAGSSRPASGAEHHISHFLEMGTPWLPDVDALHGEKVGVGTVLALERYRGWIGKSPDALASAVAAWRPYTPEQLRGVFGGLTELVLKENADCCLKKADPARITARWDRIQSLLRALPEAKAVKAKLAALGGKTSLSDLGVDEGERDRILLWSPTVRNRLTFMRLLHTMELK